MLRRQNSFWFISILLLAFVSFSSQLLADIGVGVGTGKIEVQETIMSGGIYTLPPITVFNTGDERATYAMHVTLNETQEELKPDPSWFTFEPSSFELDPGKSQVVTPRLRPPLKTPAGNYFGYLEAYPDSTVSQGRASVGVAAATKLSFRVESSNKFVAIATRLKALFEFYAPWSYFVTGTLFLAGIILILRKFIKLDIKISRTATPKNSPKEDQKE